MKDAIHRILDRTEAATEAIGRDFSTINAAAGRNAPLLMLALTPPLLAAFAVTEIGVWALDEIGRQIRIHEKRPASPSLRGTPTPADIVEPWSAFPRTLRDRLRLGSRLADLDPTLDHTIARTTLPSGKTVFRSRPGGMKGWLEDRRVAVPYSTVMRYKKLAQRLRQVLALDDRLPLEWLIDGLPASANIPSALLSQYRSARRRLAALLRENRTFKDLSRNVEKQLGIVRLVAIRKVSSRHRGQGDNRRKSQSFSVISCDRRVTVTPERFEATKAAMERILGAAGLSGPALHLQNRLRRWLSALPHPGQKLDSRPRPRYSAAP